eukprot:scaffold846_cov252-Pinguiococcus_pyrenoidosus.AAC.19
MSAIARDADRPARVDALEEELLQGIVVPSAIDQLLRLQLALVAALVVHFVAFLVGHLLALQVHARAAHVDEVLQSRRAYAQRIQQRLRVRRLAAVHVVADVEAVSPDLLHQLLRHLRQSGSNSPPIRPPPFQRLHCDGNEPFGPRRSNWWSRGAAETDQLTRPARASAPFCRGCTA